MNNNELFIFATRTKMRFPYRGMISVEDLWDLSVQELDKIYKTLNAKAKEQKEESLLEKTSEDKVLAAQINIVKYIVNVKLKEKEIAKTAKERKEKKEKIMAIIANKQDAALQEKSVEELAKMLDDLD